jgi:hypothetical protein
MFSFLLSLLLLCLFFFFSNTFLSSKVIFIVNFCELEMLIILAGLVFLGVFYFLFF